MLQLHTRYRRAGGEDVVVDDEARLLRRAGHDVVQYISHNPDGPISASLALLQSPFNVKEVRRLQKTLVSTKPDVMHVHNTWFAPGPGVLRQGVLLDVPTLMTLHNYRLLCLNAMLLRDGSPCEDCVGKSLIRGVRHRCYRGSFAASAFAAATTTTHRALGTWHHHVDQYLAVTEFARNRFIAGGLPAHKIAVKPNFSSDLGNRHNPPSRSRRLLFVGRLAHEKGTHTFGDLARIADELGLSLDIVGDGPDRTTIERQVKAQSIQMHGQLDRNQVADLMLSARALIMPSISYEGLPRVLVEALSAGLPVVASDLGAMSQLVPEAGGFVAAVDDLRGWRVALHRLEDDATADQASIAARRRYEERYSETAALNQLESFYLRAIRAHQASRTPGTS